MHPGEQLPAGAREVPPESGGQVARRPLARRRVLGLGAALGGLALAGPALAACSRASGEEAPDPLVALAQRARTDTALVTAAITADPKLTDRLDPVRSARADHAGALEKEIARYAGATTTPTPAPAAAAPAGSADLAAVQKAVDAAAREAAVLVPTLPKARAGLVGSVAACCAAYATVLG
ncbi:hypothetical protein GCM10009836_04760 [Pseudonocardia ailaonensis]|uniref:DUF4439 domain-containing protein n=1 Tax=Pseudonocardia ailaonensis TaxID=367279 RepID=A0ABN2MJX7_9PSEU